MMQLVERVVSCVWVATVMVLAQAAWAEDPPPLFVNQPAGEFSTVRFDEPTGRPAHVQDSAFAGLIANLVTSNGQSNIMNGTFLFQQCVGGGMLDDLQAALPGNMNYVAASASLHNQNSFGPFSIRELQARGAAVPANHPMNGANWWTESLIPALNNPTVTVHDAVGASIIGNPVGTFGGDPNFRENGQRISQGTPFMLREPNAQSFHAILLAGKDDRDRYFADVKGMFDTLKNVWGDPATNPNITIDVLFGNGTTNNAGQALPSEWNAKAGTFANFQTTLNNLKPKLNQNEQFLLYVTDHGSSNKKVTNAVGGVVAGGEGNGIFTLSDSILQGYAQDLENEDPWLNVDLTFPGTPAPSDAVGMYVNDVPIFSGPVGPGQNTFSVPIPENLLGPSNAVKIGNFSQSSITINDVEFVGTGIPTLDSDVPDFLLQEFPILTDNFDQKNEFGGHRAVDLSATGPFIGDGVDLVHSPRFDITRRQFIQVNDSTATATMRQGQSAAEPGTLEISLTNAETGNDAFAAISWQIDASGDGRPLHPNTEFKLRLKETATGVGNLAVSLFDVNGFPKFIPLEPGNEPNVYWAALDNGGFAFPGFEQNRIDSIGLDIQLIAASDVGIVLDSFSVIPEPSMAVMLTLLLLTHAVRRVA